MHAHAGEIVILTGVTACAYEVICASLASQLYFTGDELREKFPSQNVAGSLD